MPRPTVDPRFPQTLRRLREERGLSLRALAAAVYQGKSYIHDFEQGRKPPTVDIARRLDDALQAGGVLTALVTGSADGVPTDDDSLDALELARRVTASDVSTETLDRLEAAFDDLATCYGTARPDELLARTRHHLAYVNRLVDARKTLDQHRRLLVVGGWLSLLAGTISIDLRQRDAAAARLATAQQLAEHAGHVEIEAWVYETRAWDRLNAGVGDYAGAVELSQRAQALAPRGSSVLIQATAQEGRAWARMGRQPETRAVLDRVARLVAPLRQPERPEHHYVYDPGKALSYIATTLAWAGDPAAEEFARTAIAELEACSDGTYRPRRVALARLDLGLALLAAGRPDEATAHAVTAIESGRVVPSNWWRVTQVVTGVTEAGIHEAADLRDAYQAHRPAITR